MEIIIQENEFIALGKAIYAASREAFFTIDLKPEKQSEVHRVVFGCLSTPFRKKAVPTVNHELTLNIFSFLFEQCGLFSLFRTTKI